MEKQTFPKDQILFREGDDGAVAYLVESGTVEISLNGGEDKKVLGLIQQGGLFGEMALINDLPRMATAMATMETTCFIIKRKVLRNLISDSDPLMSALLFNLIGHVRSLNEKIHPEMVAQNGVQIFFRGEEGVYKRRN